MLYGCPTAVRRFAEPVDAVARNRRRAVVKCVGPRNVESRRLIETGRLATRKVPALRLGCVSYLNLLQCRVIIRSSVKTPLVSGSSASLHLQGISAPHSQPGSLSHALSGWFSQTQPYAKTNRTLFIHGIETRGPRSKNRGYAARHPLQ